MASPRRPQMGIRICSKRPGWGLVAGCKIVHNLPPSDFRNHMTCQWHAGFLGYRLLGRCIRIRRFQLQFLPGAPSESVRGFKDTQFYGSIPLESLPVQGQERGLTFYSQGTLMESTLELSPAESQGGLVLSRPR